MNGIVNFRLCDLSNKELIERVDRGTDKLYRTREIPTRYIPARPNEDYDLLVGELICRFGDLINTDKKDEYATNGPQGEEIPRQGK